MQKFWCIKQIYEGRVNDPFNEFVVAMSPKFSELSLNPDSKFWLEAFVVCFITFVLKASYLQYSS